MATDSDDFNRANNVSELGPKFSPQYPGGTNMGVGTGPTANMGFVNAVGFADGIEQYTAGSFGNNAYSTPTLGVFQGATHRQVGATLRMATPTADVAFVDFYIGAAIRNDSLYSGKTTVISIVVDGAQTVLASETATTWAATDTLKLEIIGSALSLYRNGSGTPLLTASNGTYTTGGVGIFITLESGSTDDAAIDFWEGGDAAAGGSGAMALAAAGHFGG